MNRFSQFLLLYSLSIYSINVSAIDLDDEQTAVQLINGQPVIYLDQQNQQAAGLETVKLHQLEFQAEFIAYAKAIQIDPLLSLHNRYHTAIAEQARASKGLAQTEKNISRLRNLHKDEVVSTRKLQKHQAQWQTEQAAYHAIAYQSQGLINNSKLQWGEELTQWLTDKHSAQFKKLLNGEATLLQLSLPAGEVLADQIDSIFVSPSGNRQFATKAKLISASPQVNNFSQGLQYFFFSDDQMIKVGMNLTAWVAQEKQAKIGVVIPESSLAWHLGQAFVFIKIDEEQFLHQNINSPIKVATGYFIGRQIAEGEEVVETGVQMLLSHEFRSQIPDEDDD